MIKRSVARRSQLWLLLGAVLLYACVQRDQVQEVLPTEAVIAVEEVANQTTGEPASTPTLEPTATVSPTPQPTATMSPTPSPTPEVAILTYEDEERGVSFTYPETWYVEADENAVFVFSQEDMSRAARYEEGAALLLSSSDNLAGRSAEEILDLFVGQLNLVSEQEVVAEPTTLTINGQNAAQATYEGNVENVPVVVTYTAITNGEFGAVAVSLMLRAEQDIFGDTLSDITNSITLTTPADDAYDTVFPLPDDVQNFVGEGGESQINYRTNLSLDQVIAFYRQEFSAQGLVEREALTVIEDSTFSLVFDNPEDNRAIVIQGVDLAGSINVNVRFEEGDQ
ncbi:MAG TPA: hypothetical protein VF177_13615 [Anaerolineae bacterium]